MQLERSVLVIMQQLGLQELKVQQGMFIVTLQAIHFGS